ncbi:MAG: hypothetical protein R2726_22235 [Acidimicrobiales bacterium]
MTPAPDPGRDPSSDPVVARRQQVARWARIAQRVGYLLFGVALVLFFVGFATREFSSGIVTGLEICLIGGSILLAPSIVVGYAVKAADRADREDDWR